jgi:hypothetical protein
VIPLAEAMASSEEALFTRWKKRWYHLKKLYIVHTGLSYSLAGRSSIYSQEEARASPEVALFTHLKEGRPHRKKLYGHTERSDILIGRSSLCSLE